MYIETSAKTALNVEQAFMDLSYKIYEKMSRGELIANEDGTDGIKISKNLLTTSPHLATAHQNPNYTKSTSLEKNMLSNSQMMENKDSCSC